MKYIHFQPTLNTFLLDIIHILCYLYLLHIFVDILDMFLHYLLLKLLHFHMNNKYNRF